MTNGLIPALAQSLYSWNMWAFASCFQQKHTRNSKLIQVKVGYSAGVIFHIAPLENKNQSWWVLMFHRGQQLSTYHNDSLSCPLNPAAFPTTESLLSFVTKMHNWDADWCPRRLIRETEINNTSLIYLWRTFCPFAFGHRLCYHDPQL